MSDHEAGNNGQLNKSKLKRKREIMTRSKLRVEVKLK